MKPKLNHIYHGDCLEVMKDWPDNCVDLVLTDPPYLVAAKGTRLAGDRAYLKDISKQKLDVPFDINVLSLLNKFSDNIIVFCGKQQLKQIINWITNQKWMLLTWHKTNPTPLTNNNYLPDTEYIFHIWAKGALYGNYSTKKRYFLQPVEKNNYDHPTVKPINIIKKLILNGSKEGDIVLDPYLGSGTTVVACKELGRNYIGIEKEQVYIDIAHRRLRQEVLSL